MVFFIAARLTQASERFLGYNWPRPDKTATSNFAQRALPSAGAAFEDVAAGAGIGSLREMLAPIAISARTHSGIAGKEPRKIGGVVETTLFGTSRTDTGTRFRHGTRLLRWRADKAPEQCTMEQLVYELRPAELATLG